MESSITLAYYAYRSSSRFSSLRARASRAIIAPYAFRNALIRLSRLAASAITRVRVALRRSFSLESLSKSALKKFPSQNTPLQVHSEHLDKSPENTQSVRARVHRIHETIAIALSRLIFTASVERRAGEGIF
jgi:hypothetical protein